MVMKFPFTAAALLLALVAAPEARAQYDSLQCKSRDFRHERCDVDTRGGVRLVRQLSRNSCVEGRTWGWDRRGVWVDQGCEGEFEIGGAGYNNGGGGGGGGYSSRDTVVCESKDDRRRHCAADLRGRDVAVLRNISRVPCAEGSNWGYDDRGIWVDQGCRAEFGITGRRGGGGGDWRPGPGGGGGGNTSSVRCESKDHNRNYCDVGRGGDVFLVRQRSKARCVEGQTWGYDNRGIWVDQGCAADFEVRGWR